MKKCRYIKCEKNGSGWVETRLGWFCSEECRSAVTTRIARFLMGDFRMKGDVTARVDEANKVDHTTQ